MFVMGDHRLVSQDARCQGPVPIDNVIGRAFVIVWPSSRWDGLSVPDTFDDVPTAGRARGRRRAVRRTGSRRGRMVLLIAARSSLRVGVIRAFRTERSMAPAT